MSLAARWRSWSRTRKLILISLATLLLGASAGAGWLAWRIDGLLYGFEAPSLAERPRGAGARGEGWEVREHDGVPLLWVNGLPYPTWLDATRRPQLSLDGDWQLRLDDKDAGIREAWFNPVAEGWGERTVAVPGSVDAWDGPHRDRDGILWFRRRFRLDPDPAVALWRLRFGAVLMRARVWLNGQELGAHEGGYAPFFLDATPALKAGENLIVLRCEDTLTADSVPPEARDNYRPGWAPYGGITRPVSLEGLPARAIIKVAAEAQLPADGPATLALTVITVGAEAGGERLRVALQSPSGAPAGEAQSQITSGAARVHRLSLPIAEPQRYAPGDPQLYRLTLTAEQRGSRDEVTVLTGLREVAVAGDALLLNGAPLFLKGLAKHEDHPRFGAANPKEVRDADWDLIEALGANYMRLAHYPHNSAELAEARDRGVLVSEEVPLYHAGMGWIQWLWKGQDGDAFPEARFGTRQLYRDGLLANAQLQLIEMVERDRNNPAVIMWSVGNENFSLTEDCGPVHGWLREVVRAFDTTRPVTVAEWTAGAEVLDSRRHASDDMDIISLNMYPGWYFGEASDAGALLDSARARWPDKPILISECGAGAALGRSEADGPVEVGITPSGKAFSEEYQAQVLETIWGQARERPWVRGVTPWVFADFYCPWFKENPVPGFNLKGVVSRDREPKESYRLLQRLFKED